MKKTLALVISLLVFANVFATDVVPVDNAKQASKNFLSANFRSLSNLQTTDLTLRHTEVDANGEPLYYHFQIKDHGFILVSATNLVSPILGYSVESDLTSNDNVDLLLNSYKQGISAIKANGIPEANATKAWKQYDTDNFVQMKDNLKHIDRLLSSKFNQPYPYNTYCPADEKSSDGHSPVGCVAVSMSQIANYYRYPTTGVGGLSYIPENYPRQTVIFKDQTYNYDAICSSPTKDNSELAKLSYHMGVSVKMGYTSSSSGAVSAEALESLKSFWQFDNATYYQTQDVISGGLDVWGDSILKPELDQYRPIVYSAQDAEENGNGHSFMIDGYREVMEGENVATYFHVNWGWGGACDGEFKIDYLHDDNSPEFKTMGNFIYHLGVMLKLCPPDSACQKPAEGFIRNTASAGSISDGAGHVDYPNNTNRTWMIAAPDAKSYTFTFERLNTEKLQDFITIYNGPTEESGIAGTFSGHYNYDELPAAITVNADSVLVKFTTDGSNTDKGFVLYYNSSFKSTTTCENLKFMTTSTGSITEGSQDGKPYRGQMNCGWRIRVNGAKVFNVNFKKFELGKGDFVDIQDNNNVTLARFDMNNYPQGYYSFESNATLNVKFTSDNWDEMDGFVMEYAAGNTGINMESGLEDVTVYPNPANSYINVDFTSDKAENIAFKVVDVTGKIVYSEQFNHAGGEFHHQFNISNLSEGFYFMNIETAQGKAVKKFIVR